MYGTGTANSDLIPQSLLVDIAKQMDELNKPPPPPEGLDAAIFGERGSLQREFAVSLGNGMIKP